MSSALAVRVLAKARSIGLNEHGLGDTISHQLVAHCIHP